MRYSIVFPGRVDIALVESSGASSIKVQNNSPIAFANMNEFQAQQLRDAGLSVSEVEKISPLVSPPKPVSGAPVYTPSELVDYLGIEHFRGLTIPPLEGNGINVAVIGTGIRSTHQDLDGMVVSYKNYTASPVGDGFDHDTGVAAIIHTVVPKSKLYDFKVIDDSGSGTSEAFVQAVDDAIDFFLSSDPDAPRVINISLGAIDDGNWNNPMRVMCRGAVNAGMLLFASAGNGGPFPMSIACPACDKLVLAVGSCSYEPFIVSAFSSRGPTIEGLIKPDAVMFGEDIIMPSSKSDTATTAKSGTSFSAPFASGAGVLFLDGERAWGEFANVPAFIRQQVPYPMTGEGMIETFLPTICIKPEGVALQKDNDYGSGMPYGALILEQVAGAVTPGLAIGSLITMMMVMMMMTMMTKSMGGK